VKGFQSAVVYHTITVNNLRAKKCKAKQFVEFLRQTLKLKRKFAIAIVIIKNY